MQALNESKLLFFSPKSIVRLELNILMDKMVDINTVLKHFNFPPFCLFKNF